MRHLAVVGDCLLDRDLQGRVERLCSDAPAPVVEDLVERSRPGGAGLAATLAARSGRPVRLVTALARDPGGEELRSLLDAAGVEVVDLGLEGATPIKIRVRTGGQTLLRLDQSGEGGPVGEAGEDALGAIAEAEAVLVSDYGLGITSEPRLRATLASPASGTPLVWDPHPRGADPVPGAALVKPNRREAGGQRGLRELARRAETLRRRWAARGVVVTMAGDGALLVTGEGPPLVAPAGRRTFRDPCGAGDCFSVTATELLARGAGLAEAVTAAVEEASRFVAEGWVSGEEEPPVVEPGSGLEHALEVARQARARGGRVVATGGCFDLLHAGHVEALEAARRLGGCLIVCLNSDASVRRLKGPERPIVPETDRARVLLGLSAVDAVVVFDEDTPVPVLRRLRPDVFVKGGDYSGADLPERRAMEEWGGELVLVPYVDGRSTTRLVEAMRHG
jgi:D-beta-D-heptose 7-phosphate kinase / D-beta-D-heptose 1-phosphate adenosyltransferase